MGAIQIKTFGLKSLENRRGEETPLLDLATQRILLSLYPKLA